MDMSNTAIRKWFRDNGRTDVNAVGNVAPEFVAEYLAANSGTTNTEKKEKKVKKEKKATVTIQNSAGIPNVSKTDDGKYWNNWKMNGVVFTGRAIHSVLIRKHGITDTDAMRDVLHAAFQRTENGESTFDALGNAAAAYKDGAETPSKATATASPKSGKGKAPKAPENGSQATVRYGVVLPGGTLVTVGSIAERDNLVSIVPNSVAVEM